MRCDTNLLLLDGLLVVRKLVEDRGGGVERRRYGGRVNGEEGLVHRVKENWRAASDTPVLRERTSDGEGSTFLVSFFRRISILLA